MSVNIIISYNSKDDCNNVKKLHIDAKEKCKMFQIFKNCPSVILKSENNELGKSEFHNDSGPITVANRRIKLKILDEFQNAAEEKGIPKTKDFNTGDNFFRVLLRIGIHKIL